jgi:putative endonuclease
MNCSRAGNEGEEIAANYLEEKGFRLVERNFHAPAGEIDIIAEDNGVLVFVEVKTWTAAGVEGLEIGVGEKKQKKIIETAKLFIQKHREYNVAPVRFDIIFVGKDGVCHFDGAFLENV